MSSNRLLLMLALLAAGYFAASVLTTFFLALFLAMLLEPWVQKLIRQKFTRPMATLLVLIAFLVFSVMSIGIASLSISSLLTELPVYSRKWGEFAARWEEISTNFGGSPVQTWNWSSILIGGVGSLYELLTVVFFSPLLLTYFLLEKENLVESFNGVAGKYCYLPRLNADLPKMVRAYFQGNIVTAGLLILSHAALFSALGLGHWLPLAVITGVLNLIPLVGIPLALILPLAQGALQFTDFYPFFMMGVTIAAFHFVASNLILPALVGSRVNLNSVAMILGLLFWGWLWGGVGFLLGIPMTALLKTALESNASTHSLSNLLAARPRHILPREKGSGKARPSSPSLLTS